MDAAVNVLKRNWRLVLLAFVLAASFAAIYVLRNVVVPFAVGLILAFLLLPAVRWLEAKLPLKGRWLPARRVISVVLVLVVILGLVGVIGVYILLGVVHSFSILIQNTPEYLADGLLTLEELTGSLQRWFPPQLEQHVQSFILDVGTAMGNSMREAFLKGISYIPTTLTLILGFVALPFFLFFILKDWEKLGDNFFLAFPENTVVHARKMVSILEEVLWRYVRAKLTLGFTVGSLDFIGLSILGIELAPALAVFAGITEIIPILGPWLGGAAGVIVTLATMPEKVIWVAMLYLGVQLLENTLLVPRIEGSYLRIHPAIVMVLLTVGAYIWGIWGMILITPVTSTIIALWKYVRRNMGDETKRQMAQL